MTELFKNQLLHELKQAGFHQAAVAEDGESIIPVPEYQGLCIKPEHIRFGADASQAERDLAHGQMRDIQQRTLDACRAWQHSQEMPGNNMGAENFRLLSEFNGVMLAARDDGVHGLHFVTWEYNYNRTSLEHGHYTTSFAGAMEDYATRAGLVSQDQFIAPENIPLLYKALKTVEGDYWLLREQEEQVGQLCRQLERLDPDVADKAGDIQLLPPDADEQEESMEQTMHDY